MITPDWPLYACRGTEMARLVRWVIAAAVVLGFAPAAFAAALDSLPGTQTVGPALFARWEGFYIGGQASYSNGSADFSKATGSLIGYSLRGLTLEQVGDPSALPVLGNANANATGLGGFVGYNTQWQDLVLGIEANYTHGPFSVVATDNPIVNHVYTIGSAIVSVNEQGTGSMNITDYGSLRARAGVIVGSNFLPYGFAGVALGRGSYNVTSLVFGQQSSPVPPATPLLPCAPS